MSNIKFDTIKFKHKKSHKHYDDDDEEIEVRPTNYIDKRKARRVERALKTKDISILIEDEDDGIDPDDYENWKKLMEEND